MIKRLVLILTLLFSCFFLTAGNRVALVLSGGGARGFAHVPIIEELERRGIVPDIVIGSSMGGLVGGLYSAGYSAQDMYRLIDDTDFVSAVFNLSQQAPSVVGKPYNEYYDRNISIGFSDSGLGTTGALLDDEQINRIIHEAFCRVESVDDFDDFPVPFRCIGTDYRTGDGLVFNSGSIYEALRATMAMPFVFPVVELDDGTYVVDGGVYNNLPVDVARWMGADIVIAVDVNESVRSAAADSDIIDTLSGSLNQYLLLVGQIKSRSQYDDATFLLIPDTSQTGVVDFGGIDQVLEAGRQFVEDNQELFDEIEKACGVSDEDVRSYFSYEPALIEGFSFPPELARFQNRFSSLVGKPYDEEAAREISRLLSIVRKLSNKLSVTYKFCDGIIQVSSRDYTNATSSFNLGLTGGMLSYYNSDEDEFKFILNPDLSLSFDFWLDQILLTPALKLGQNNMLSLTALFFMSPSWAFEAGLHGAFGGFSAISDRNYVNRYVTRDWNAGGHLDLVFLYGISHRLDLSLSYDFYYLAQAQSGRHVRLENSRIWDRQIHNLADLSLSYHFDGSHLESVQETGVDFAIEASLLYSGSWGWELRADLSGSFKVTDSSSGFIDWNVSAFSSTGPFELLRSYRIDPFGQISQDYVFTSLSYKHYLFPRSNGFYISAGFFAQALDRDDINTLSALKKSQLPFSYIDGFEAGGMLSAGYLSDFGDVSVSVMVSYSGSTAIAITLR